MPARNELPSPAAERRQCGAPSSGDREKWLRVKAVFLDALERPESERSAFVAKACGDDAGMRDDIISLLASAEAAESFCETPAAGVLGLGVLAQPRPAPRLEPKTRLGTYEISSFLSAGGMGEVYRARHTVLDRQVAIKIVNAHLSDEVAKRRLIREARHASSLSHPNICTIYEVGEADGMPFIVMEFVDGRPLNEIVRAALPVLEESLRYGMQVAEALEHAHQHGVVHRDLKSSNIVVDTKGRPIVLDFGLAKRLHRPTGDRPGDSTLTGLDALAGTLSHMAPEVLRGDPADARSDVWSLGVLLFELTTGDLPFNGRTPFETTSAILNGPPRWTGVNVPLALRLVIERCLAKDPDARYQRASEVRDALDVIARGRVWLLVGRLLVFARRRSLRRSGGAALFVLALIIAGPGLRERLGRLPSGSISTLAFLPLENATGDPRLGYYADGLTDGLIEQIGATINVRILSRASAGRAGRSAKTPADLARLLGADAIIEGRLRRVSDRIAVDIRLIQPKRGRVLWSDTYERGASQVLALQADVLRGLAFAVRLTLQPGAADRLATIRAVSPEAYEAYLKGRYEWNKRTQQSLQLAVTHFTEALRLDPTYAPAHAALADCYNQIGTVMLGGGSPREFRPRAATEAISALQLDPYSAEAHAALGYVRHYDWQWTEAEQEFRRAIELNPSYPLARVWYANLLMSRRRTKEALEQIEMARRLDPFSMIVNSNVGWTLNYAGRSEDAIAHLTWTLKLDSTYVQARWRLAFALMSAGRYPEAHSQAERLIRLTDRSPPTVALLANISATMGKKDEARALLRELLVRARQGYVPPASVAGVFVTLGELDSALPWIARAFEERSNAIAYMALDSSAGPLQRDPRFQALVVRAGLK